MAEHTSIEWCDSTFNPWIGCTRVSTAAAGGGGCDNCYAAVSTPARAMGVEWRAGAPRHRTAKATWKKPGLWEREHEAFELAHGRRRRVFCASLADVFDNEVAVEWRTDLWVLIEQTPHLDWLLLTKRIGNVASMVPDRWLKPGNWPAHVWLGATVVNQAEADRDITKLLAVPARVRFLSIEPMLGPIDLLAAGDVLCHCEGCLSMLRKHPESPGLQRIDWIIAGGESGPKARPMHPDWARSLRDQCAAASVPFLFKQWGKWGPFDGSDDERQHGLSRIGKKAAGRLLDGVEHNGFPA